METAEHTTTTAERPIVMAGRTFRQSESTSVQQDAWTMRRYRSSGLADLARQFDPSRDELPALAERLLWDGLESGVIYEILAGILTEDGVVWSRESATRNATFFAQLTDPSDKAIVYSRLSDVLHDFLAVAAVSKRTFEKSSESPETNPPHDGDGDGNSNAPV